MRIRLLRWGPSHGAPGGMRDVATVHDRLAQQVIGQGRLTDCDALDQPGPWHIGVRSGTFAEVLIRSGLDAVGQHAGIAARGRTSPREWSPRPVPTCPGSASRQRIHQRWRLLMDPGKVLSRQAGQAHPDLGQMHGDLTDVPLPHRVSPRILDGAQQSRDPPNLFAKRILAVPPASFHSSRDHVLTVKTSLGAHIR